MVNEFKLTSKTTGKNKSADLNHTKISFLLIMLAASIMMFIGLRHINDVDTSGQEWGKFAILQSCLCFAGYFGGQIVTKQPLFPKQFAIPNIDTGIRAMMILAAAQITQIITQYTLSVSNTEKAVYYVFAAVCEESFFRLFLINAVTCKSNDLKHKVAAVIISAAAFASIHINYYGDFAMLAGVAIGGIILGILYLVWKDITANILGHFILNIIATYNWLVRLSAAPAQSMGYSEIITVLVLILIITGILLVIVKKIEVKEKMDKPTALKQFYSKIIALKNQKSIRILALILLAAAIIYLNIKIPIALDSIWGPMP